MINISEEIKSFVDEVEFFGGKFDPFFVDEDNKLLIHLDSVINKHRFNDKMIIEAIFLMYKKFETRDVKADIEVRIILKDRKIQSVYYEPQYMAVIEEEGDLVGVQPLYFDDPRIPSDISHDNLKIVLNACIKTVEEYFYYLNEEED